MAPLTLQQELEPTLYRPVRALAAGAHAEVILVEHRELGGPSVMKLVHPKEEPLASELARRLRIEGRLLRSIHHENLLEVRDFGATKSGRAFLVTEFLSGRTLKDEVQARGPLPLAEALEVTAQILRGLAAAHEAGLVHRDIKPDNIFYCEPARDDAPRVVKILDFGIAKLVTESAQAIAGEAAPTAPDLLLGTPLFLSPEQIRCAPLDGRTDIYALGGVLYYLLTGRAPFPLRRLDELLRAHLVQPAPSPSSLRPEVPFAIDRIVAIALAKATGERFPSAKAMLDAIEPIQGALDERVPTSPMRKTQVLGATPAPSAPSIADEAPTSDLEPTKPAVPKPPVLRYDAPVGPRGRAPTMKLAQMTPPRPAIRETVNDPALARAIVGKPAAPPAPSAPAAPPLAPAPAKGRALRVAIWIASVIFAVLTLKLLEHCGDRASRAVGTPQQLRPETAH